MCGICGIIKYDNNSRVDVEVVKKMTDAICHRGPDEDGYYFSGKICLGMRRLSIIDIVGGSQPIFNETRRICVVFNGEIYNYKELRNTLLQLGHTFYTNSDTEAIVHAYEQWGTTLQTRLRGMFAYAIYDDNTETLTLVRDRLGKKPIYYFEDGKQFIFSSEIKSILEIETVPRRLNLEALNHYLTLGYVPAPLTLFEGIFKLPAGSYLELKGSEIQIKQYWDIDFTTDHNIRFQEARETIISLLENAINIRLMSEVPLGAFLSGGIDSSIIVGFMSKQLSHPVDTFTVGFDEAELNELPYAKIIANYFGTHHHEILLRTLSPDILSRIVWHLDEPIADPAAVPIFLISELARNYVTVVLTGEGGDEIFAGYDYYKSQLMAKRYQKLSFDINKKFLPYMAQGINSVLQRQYFHNRTIWFWSLPRELQSIAWVAIFTDEEKKKISNLENCRSGLSRIVSPSKQYFHTILNGVNDLNRLMYLDTKIWLPDDLLMKVDKMCMAHSIEARTPFLDHELMQFAASLPASYKLKGDVSKWILKDIGNSIIPNDILNRPKHTFDVPVGKWIKGSLREITKSLLTSGEIGGVPILNPSYIFGHMWQCLEADVPGYARQFWSLINLALWAQLYKVQVEI